MASGFNTRLNGEDIYDAARRGEGTSQVEKKIDSAMEGMHAEDHPDLVATIKTAQQAEEIAKEEVEQAWLAAKADGTVQAMKGEITRARLDAVAPQETDNEIEALRKLRLAQMRGRAELRAQWLERGHGTYVALEQESSFLQALPKHERTVCALCMAGSLDGELLHTHMRALARVHMEAYFCWLDPERAPVMMGMVDVGRLPALLLCLNGKVVHALHGIDRSFTTEGVAYELGHHKIVDFEEGLCYSSVKGGCTTATANHSTSGRHVLDDPDDDLDDDIDIDEWEY